MTFWIKALKVFAFIWLTLAILFIATGLVGIWMQKGFSGVQDTLSPFNIANWLVTALTLAPGFAAKAWATKLESKAVYR